MFSMTKWKNSPYAQLGAALLFIATAALLLYLNQMMVLTPESSLMENMRSDRTFYIIGIATFTALPFYFLYRAWRIMRVKNYDEAAYVELWQKPGSLITFIFFGVMILAAVATYLMIHVEMNLYT